MPIEENRQAAIYFEENHGGRAYADVAGRYLDRSVQIHFMTIPEVLTFEKWIGLQEVFQASFSDLTHVAQEALAEDNRVMVRWFGWANHTGEFQGLPATGKKVEVGGMSVYRFNNGKIVESWHYWDAVSLMMQLGMLSAPAAA